MLAIRGVATAAGLAGSVFAAEKSDAYALADLPGRDARPDLLDAANCFVAWNSRIYDAGELRFNCAGIRMANATSLYADTYLALTWGNDRPLDKTKCPGSGYFHCLIG
jgi:hypothetical protein